jgi:hypothetical protein
MLSLAYGGGLVAAGAASSVIATARSLLRPLVTLAAGRERERETLAARITLLWHQNRPYRRVARNRRETRVDGQRVAMGDKRKLQTEIERTLKKVQEGVEIFDGIWNKGTRPGEYGVLERRYPLARRNPSRPPWLSRPLANRELLAS